VLASVVQGGLSCGARTDNIFEILKSDIRVLSKCFEEGLPVSFADRFDYDKAHSLSATRGLTRIGATGGSSRRQCPLMSERLPTRKDALCNATTTGGFLEISISIA